MMLPDSNPKAKAKIGNKVTGGIPLIAFIIGSNPWRRFVEMQRTTATIRDKPKEIPNAIEV